MTTIGFLSRLAGVVMFGTSLCGCSESAAPEGAARPPGKAVICPVNYPLAYFAERVAGDAAEVRFLAPADGDPAFWEPTDEDVAALQAADLILLNGATYAKWLGHVSLPASRTVDTSKAFADGYITVEEVGTHRHGQDGEHAHAGTAFTTWLDLQLAGAHVEAVQAALTRLRPDDADRFAQNAAALRADLEALDADVAAAAARLGRQPLVASHPVYQYFARRYDLDIEAVLWEPETVPDDAAMGDLRAVLADHPAQWMIWEGEPDPASVAKLEAIGVRSVVFDPCGNRPDDGDWLAVMRTNVENLRSMQP